MWNLSLIERLKKFTENKDFLVYYQSHRVLGIDLVPLEHKEMPPNQAVFYLENDGPLDGIIFAETQPSDFQVSLLVDWEYQTPNT